MENSKIAWTTHTFNPWIGCEAVSPGCANCYAAAQDRRWGKNRFGHGFRREKTSDANWDRVLRWEREAARTGDRPRVFCASMADVFDPTVSPSWRAKLHGLIRKTPHLWWLILTKRELHAMDVVSEWAEANGPLSNVFLGVTAENQEQWNARVPVLMGTPGVAGRFVSVEPMLGPIDPAEIHAKRLPSLYGNLKPVDWVICGAESGAGARLFFFSWAHHVLRACAVAGVPFFMKQVGANPATTSIEGLPRGSAYKDVGKNTLVRMKERAGADPEEWPEFLRVRQFPAIFGE